MNKIQLQIKIKKAKKHLIKRWYKLMKPLANLVDAIEKKHRDKFNKKAKSMTIEEVVERLTKLIIKDLVRHSDLKWKYNLELEVANGTKYDEYDNTLVEYMQKQHKDKKLKLWACNGKNNLETNKKLAILLKIALANQKCKVKQYEREFPFGYSYKKPEDYQYTIQISL